MFKLTKFNCINTHGIINICHIFFYPFNNFTETKLIVKTNLEITRNKIKMYNANLDKIRKKWNICIRILIESIGTKTVYHKIVIRSFRNC